MWTGRSVVDEMSIRLPLSMQVAIMAAIDRHADGGAAWARSALFRDSPIDYLLRVFCLVGLAVPAFWFGMVIILLLLWLFNWLPPVIYTPFWVDPVANLSQLIWPALVVGIPLRRGGHAHGPLLGARGDEGGLHPHGACQGRSMRRRSLFVTR